MRFAAIAKCQHLWPLAWLCKTLEVARGGFYAWIKRPESERARVDTQLTAAIRTSFAESDLTYGARRVRRDLCDWGHPCGVHRIVRAELHWYEATGIGKREMKIKAFV